MHRRAFLVTPFNFTHAHLASLRSADLKEAALRESGGMRLGVPGRTSAKSFFAMATDGDAHFAINVFHSLISESRSSQKEFMETQKLSSAIRGGERRGVYKAG
jgi:hypothetical protein